MAEWTQVDSSNLKAYRYDKTGMALDVQFKNGSVYRYNGVPMTVAKNLGQASSVGSFFASNVKSIYEVEKLS